MLNGPWVYLVALVAAFVIATLASPVGVSGAVLLLPFQVSVLGTPSPAVATPRRVVSLLAPEANGRLAHPRPTRWNDSGCRSRRHRAGRVPSEPACLRRCDRGRARPARRLDPGRPSRHAAGGFEAHGAAQSGGAHGTRGRCGVRRRHLRHRWRIDSCSDSCWFWALAEPKSPPPHSPRYS